MACAFGIPEKFVSMMAFYYSCSRIYKSVHKHKLNNLL